MAVIVQDNTGLIIDANSYISVAEFEAYATLRGYDLTAYTDAQKEASVINATDYIDNRFEFLGVKTGDSAQTTELPRSVEVDYNYGCITYEIDTYTDLGINQITKNACSEYAYNYLTSGDLFSSFDKSAGLIKRSKSKVGPIEEETEFQNSSYSSSAFPIYQKADNLMKKSGNIDNQSFNSWKI